MRCQNVLTLAFLAAGITGHPTPQDGESDPGRADPKPGDPDKPSEADPGLAGIIPGPAGLILGMFVDGLPQPTCAAGGDGGVPFPREPVLQWIEDFCGNKKYYKSLIVPPISTGQGWAVEDPAHDPDWKPGDLNSEPKTRTMWRVLGISENHVYDNDRGYMLDLGVMFDNSNKGCKGSQPFTEGNNDEEKMDHCRKRFRHVLDDCQTNTTTNKYGGTIQDKCLVYTIKTQVQSSADPFDVETWWHDRGDLTCKEEGDACTCWYSNYDTATESFKKPEGGCDPANIHKDTDLLNP